MVVRRPALQAGVDRECAALPVFGILQDQLSHGGCQTSGGTEGRRAPRTFFFDPMRFIRSRTVDIATTTTRGDCDTVDRARFPRWLSALPR